MAEANQEEEGKEIYLPSSAYIKEEIKQISNEIENPTIEYKETPYRWFVVIAYSTSLFANGMQWVTMSAVSSAFSEAYGLAMWKVNMFSLIYCIVYPFVSLPEGWLVDDWSVRWSIIISSACTLGGSLLRLLINKSMAMAYIGQVIIAIFQPALLNSPGKIAANWFREDIRNLICTVCCLADTVGILVGMLWNMLFIDSDAEGQEFRDQFFWYIFSEGMVSFVLCTPAFFITKDKPDIPPSPSQDNAQNAPKMCEGIKLLFTNKRFIILLICMTCVFGYYNTIGSICTSLFEQYGVDSNKSNVVFAVSNIAGMIASVLLAKLLDKFKKFKLFLVLLSFAGTLSHLLFTILLEVSLKTSINAYAISLVLYSFIYMVVIPYYSIAMNYACEITYPVGESLNGGIVMGFNQLIAVPITFLCQYFIDNHTDKKYLSNIILLIMFFISDIFVFLFDERLDRQEVDQKGRIELQRIKEEKNNKINNINNE